MALSSSNWPTPPEQGLPKSITLRHQRDMLRYPQTMLVTAVLFIVVTMKSLEVRLNTRRPPSTSWVFPTNHLSHSWAATPLSHGFPRPYLWRGRLRLGLWFPQGCVNKTSILYNSTHTTKCDSATVHSPRSGCHQGSHLPQTLSLLFTSSSPHSLCVCPDLSQGGLSQGPAPMTSFNFNFLFNDLSPNTITLKKHNSACKWVTPFKERDQTGRSHPRHPGSEQDLLMKLRGMVQPQASPKFNVDTV